jgi:hypothetical protein
MSLALAQELDAPADVLAPEQPLTMLDTGLSRDTHTSLARQSAARRRGERDGVGRPHSACRTRSSSRCSSTCASRCWCR